MAAPWGEHQVHVEGRMALVGCHLQGVGNVLMKLCCLKMQHGLVSIGSNWKLAHVLAFGLQLGAL